MISAGGSVCARAEAIAWPSTFQTTPRAYLMRMRIIHACGLLLRTRLPITEVALQSGFYDHSDFARQFRRQMGLPASSYRQGGGARPVPPPTTDR